MNKHNLQNSQLTCIPEVRKNLVVDSELEVISVLDDIAHVAGINVEWELESRRQNPTSRS